MMTAVIVQCRMSSTRFPGKALKDLGGRPVLAWTLSAMKKVKADAYYVATDEASFSELEPVARSCGWDIFSGPLDDVLKRFCLLIEKIDADVVVRATADNPFLFYEAAESLLDEYMRRIALSPCDYMTWTGLPHGSGVEVFSGKSLVAAEKSTSLPYDREHVAPSLYNHRNRFSAVMQKAPTRFYYPDCRTTIDTPSDYRRALSAVRFLSKGKAGNEPYTTEQILSAFSEPSVTHPVLFVPSVKEGGGTGHLRRSLDAAIESGALVYIPKDASLRECGELTEQAKGRGLSDWQIVTEYPLPGEYSLIVSDFFSLDKHTASSLCAAAPLAAIDEGSDNTCFCDYLIDIIPSNLSRKSNISESAFMTMPSRTQSGERCKKFSDIKTVLVCFGGEDPSSLTVPVSISLRREGLSVSAVVPEGIDSSEAEAAGVTCMRPVPVLREILSSYDLVVTHYGLTAYEAAYAGCAVLLFSPTKLHASLAKKYGFVCLEKKDAAGKKLHTVLSESEKLYPHIDPVNRHTSLGAFIASLAKGKRFSCPVCGQSDPEKNAVVSRTLHRTFRRCASCGMIYMSWTDSNAAPDYDKTYFAEEYKAQYGKTYLEDFDAIKAQGVRRIREIDSLVKNKKRFASKLSVLDVGCAYGPFLAAAAEDGWQVFGADVSKDAVSYVQSSLLFPASCTSFPDFDPASEFGVRQFDALTMWYVIEHFQNLDRVLESALALVKDGGIFAFSTPSAEGVSALMNTDDFYAQSPADHYTLWEPSKAKHILKRFGFTVEKIISTGHHPERFPQVKKHGWQKDSLMYSLYAFRSRISRLGDTFEVYCRKTGGAEEGEKSHE